MSTILITGCSSGIGYELIEPLLDRGWTVVATLRDAVNRESIFTKFNTNTRGKLFVRELDVTVPSDIEKIAAFIQGTCNGQLDCLINNAGYGVFGPLELTSADQTAQQFNVNVLGVINLTRALLPFLRKSKGKLINVSSILGLIGLPQSSLYCSSKFAIEGLTESLYYELKPHGVRVSIVEPGGFRTKFGHNINWAVSQTVSEDARTAYEQQASSYRSYLSRKLSSPGNSLHPLIRRIIRTVESKSPPLRVRAGMDCQLGYMALRLLPLPIRLKITELGLRVIAR